MEISSLESSLSAVDSLIGGVVVAPPPSYPFISISSFKARVDESEDAAIACAQVMWNVLQHKDNPFHPGFVAFFSKAQTAALERKAAGEEPTATEKRLLVQIGSQYARFTLNILRKWKMSGDEMLAERASLFAL
jgi:hypothetical protein